MTTAYEVWREKTGDSTYYKNFSDAIAAAWDIFVRDSKGIEVDMRECWSRWQKRIGQKVFVQSPPSK